MASVLVPVWVPCSSRQPTMPQTIPAKLARTPAPPEKGKKKEEKKFR
jgi:hypothetical protein